MYLPGDYMLIDISKLDIARGAIPTTLAGIDALTKYFTKAEIISSIKRANIAKDKYLEGELVIQDNQNHNPLIVIDKDYCNDFDIKSYLKENINNKVFLNKVENKLRNLISADEIADLSSAIKYQDIDTLLILLYNLPYAEFRKFLIYLIDLSNKEIKEISERIRKNNIDNL